MARNKYIVSVGSQVMTVYHNSVLHQMVRCWDGKQMTQEQAERTVLVVLRCAIVGAPLAGCATSKMVEGVCSIIESGGLDDAIKEGSMYGGMA